MFPYGDSNLRLCLVNMAPGRDQRILCGGKEPVCNYSFAIDVTLRVDNPQTDHGKIIIFQISSSSSLCFFLAIPGRLIPTMGT